MEGLKRIFKNVDINKFKKSLFFCILLIIALIAIGSINFTEARYENDTEISINPTLAFFIVDVESQTQQIKLEDMTPRTEPYLYTFNVSNFNSEKRANVDLTYAIEIITTTNIPLNYQVFKGNGTTNSIDADTTTTDDNGVYFRHLVMNGVSTMNYNTNVTDTYTLRVEFPVQYKNNAEAYEGIIELVDIKINAEQVV